VVKTCSDCGEYYGVIPLIKVTARFKYGVPKASARMVLHIIKNKASDLKNVPQPTRSNESELVAAMLTACKGKINARI
jgi:hypothetical protein